MDDKNNTSTAPNHDGDAYTAASRRGFAKAAVAVLAVVGFGGAALSGVLARHGDDDARYRRGVRGGSGGSGGSGGGSGSRRRRRRRDRRRRRQNGDSGGSGSGGSGDD